MGPKLISVFHEHFLALLPQISPDFSSPSLFLLSVDHISCFPDCCVHSPRSSWFTSGIEAFFFFSFLSLCLENISHPMEIPRETSSASQMGWRSSGQSATWSYCILLLWYILTDHGHCEIINDWAQASPQAKKWVHAAVQDLMNRWLRLAPMGCRVNCRAEERKLQAGSFENSWRLYC